MSGRKINWRATLRIVCAAYVMIYQRVGNNLLYLILPPVYAISNLIFLDSSTFFFKHVTRGHLWLNKTTLKTVLKKTITATTNGKWKINTVQKKKKKKKTETNHKRKTVFLRNAFQLRVKLIHRMNNRGLLSVHRSYGPTQQHNLQTEWRGTWTTAMRK